MLREWREAGILARKSCIFDEVRMGPKTRVAKGDFFRQSLREQINLTHPLVGLADLINWDRLGASMNESFVSRMGRPATSPRLIAGPPYLQHAFGLSDEELVWQWVENPYWQVFTGETYLQTELPIDPSSLTRWRKRLGEAGVEELLAETIETTKRAGVIKASSVKRVIVDTTSMQKAIAYPTDGEGFGAARIEAAAELQSRGLALGRPDQSLRAHQAIQANEQIAAHVALSRWPGDARCEVQTELGER
jgi:transposase, IS5 family